MDKKRTLKYLILMLSALQLRLNVLLYVLKKAATKESRRKTDRHIRQSSQWTRHERSKINAKTGNVVGRALSSALQHRLLRYRKLKGSKSDIKGAATLTKAHHNIQEKGNLNENHSRREEAMERTAI